MSPTSYVTVDGFSPAGLSPPSPGAAGKVPPDTRKSTIPPRSQTRTDGDRNCMADLPTPTLPGTYRFYSGADPPARTQGFTATRPSNRLPFGLIGGRLTSVGHGLARATPGPTRKGSAPKGKAPMSGFPSSNLRRGSGQAAGTGTPALIAGLSFRKR